MEVKEWSLMSKRFMIMLTQMKLSGKQKENDGKFYIVLASEFGSFIKN